MEQPKPGVPLPDVNRLIEVIGKVKFKISPPDHLIPDFQLLVIIEG